MMVRTEPGNAAAAEPAANKPARGSLLTMPAIVVLLLWSVLPLMVTLWFSMRRYNLMNPGRDGFDGLGNYRYLFSDPGLGIAIWNTVLLLGAVLAISIGLGTLMALLLDQDFYGRGVVRVLMLAPFFVMPTVSALLWKNMMMHPDNGFLAFLMRSVGLKPIDWFAVAPLTSIIVIVSWGVAAVCRAHPADCPAVAGRRAQGSGADGRRGTGCHVPLHHLAAPWPGCCGNHHDRDHLRARHLRRDLRDQLRGAGLRFNQSLVPHLSVRVDGV